MSNEPHVWVIEDNWNGIWRPSSVVINSRSIAREEKAILEDRNPGLKFRIRKYERVDA